MNKKVMEYIEKHSMINKGDKIIVAISGGPDSVCLMHMLSTFKKHYDLKLYAAHVNHCMRGAESDRDEEYVKTLCADLEIPFYSRRVDINKYAREHNVSSETAGREVRYAFFDELMIKLGAQKIAVAHNANDQAETVLMRVFRGAGIDGLKGIRPVRDNVFIRPLLILNRCEIEEYCRKEKLQARIDSSNLETIYNRNKIRLELIPYIQNNFNEDIISTLNRLVDLVSIDSEYIEEIVCKRYGAYVEIKHDKVVIKKAAFMEKDAILTRIIRKAIMDLKGNINNIESTHIYDIILLQKRGTGKSIMLPERVIAENIYDSISLYIKNNKESNEKKQVCINIDKMNIEQLKGTQDVFSVDVEELGKTAQFKIIQNENVNFKRDEFVKYFDYDRVRNSIKIRTRKDGDKFVPYGMPGSKKLKDFFINMKISKEQRESIPILCFDHEIAWIVGFRVSELFKVTSNTKEILEVRFFEGRKGHE